MIHENQYGMNFFRGGFITFSTDVNVNSNRLSNVFRTVVNRFTYRKTIGAIVATFNQTNKSSDFIGGFSLSKYFDGCYLADNGTLHSERSLKIEIAGMSSDGLLFLGELICRYFNQESCLICDNNLNKVYLANGTPSFEKPDFRGLNTECK